MLRKTLFNLEVAGAAILAIAFLGIWMTFAGPQMHVAETFIGLFGATALFLTLMFSSRRRLKRRNKAADELQQAARIEQEIELEEEVRKRVNQELEKHHKPKLRTRENTTRTEAGFEDPIKAKPVQQETQDLRLKPLITDILDDLTIEQQEELRAWLDDLLEIKAIESKKEQLKHLGQNLKKSGAIAPVAKNMLSKLKKHGWDDLGQVTKWAVAFGGGALMLFGGAGAGVAAFGGAIGVPLFVVFGAGGAVAGAIIQEIDRKRKR